MTEFQLTREIVMLLATMPSIYPYAAKAAS